MDDSFCISFLFLFIFFMALKKLLKPSTPNLPPGPWQLPIIGNLHQLLLTSSLPHQSLQKLAKNFGPLMYLKLGEISTIVVSSPEIAKQVFRTHDTDFAQRPFLLSPSIISYNCTNIVFAPYSDYWRELRKICTMELLSPKRVQSFRCVREEEIFNLISEISSHPKGSVINFSEMIFSSTYGITSRAAFGRKYKDQKAFISVVMEATKISSGFCLADFFPSFKFLEMVTGLRPQLENLHKKADEILENIIKEHNSKTRREKIDNGEMEEDLVDILLRVRQHGNLEIPLSYDNIKAVIWDMFSAGSETSSTAIEWAMSEILKNPEVLKRAQEEVREVFKDKGIVDEKKIGELKYLNCIIKETLRLHNPVPLIPRESRTNVKINGYNIPAKTKVSVNIWAIGRDPNYWNEAEKFEPERFMNTCVNYKGTDFEFIPFGAGRRICPGMSFGLASIELSLAKLLYHFDWKLPAGEKNEDLDMGEAYGLTMRRKHDLLLLPITYHYS